MERCPQKAPEFHATRPAQNDVRDAILAGERNQSLGDIFMLEDDHQPPHLLCRFECFRKMALRRGVDSNRRLLRGAHIDGIPLGIQHRGQPGSLPEHAAGIRTEAADGNHDLSKGADLLFLLRVVALLAIQKVRRLAERHLAEACEILAREEVGKGGLDSFLGVDFSRIEPFL